MFASNPVSINGVFRTTLYPEIWMPLNPYGAEIIFNDFYMNYQVGFATFLLVFM